MVFKYSRGGVRECVPRYRRHGQGLTVVTPATATTASCLLACSCSCSCSCFRATSHCTCEGEKTRRLLFCYASDFGDGILADFFRSLFENQALFENQLELRRTCSTEALVTAWAPLVGSGLAALRRTRRGSFSHCRCAGELGLQCALKCRRFERLRSQSKFAQTISAMLAQYLLPGTAWRFPRLARSTH